MDTPAITEREEPWGVTDPGSWKPGLTLVPLPLLTLEPGQCHNRFQKALSSSQFFCVTKFQFQVQGRYIWLSKPRSHALTPATLVLGGYQRIGKSIWPFRLHEWEMGSASHKVSNSGEMTGGQGEKNVAIHHMKTKPISSAQREQNRAPHSVGAVGRLSTLTGQPKTISWPQKHRGFFHMHCLKPHKAHLYSK